MFQNAVSFSLQLRLQNPLRLRNKGYCDYFGFLFRYRISKLEYYFDFNALFLIALHSYVLLDTLKIHTLSRAHNLFDI